MAMNTDDSFTSAKPPPSPASASKRTLWASSLLAWLQKCADSYAAAAAYEDLSHRSDAELRHLSLSRDILYRDLSATDDTQPRPAAPVSLRAGRAAPPSRRNQRWWWPKLHGPALQAAAALMILLGLIAILISPLLFKDATHTAARDKGGPIAVEPVVDRF